MVNDSFAKDLEELDKQEVTTNLSINELKSIALSKVGELTDLYPKRQKPPVIRTIIKKATNLYDKAKATKEDLSFVIDELNKEITKKNSLNEKAEKEALREANRKALEEEKILNEAQNGTLDENILANMANIAPDSKTHTNPFRPRWIYFDDDSKKWKLNSNLLANTIIDENSILRMEENGEPQGYWIYKEQFGGWSPISRLGIDNLINSYFEYPADPQTKAPEMYALDQQTAQNQRDVLKLVESKIAMADPKKTIDTPPKYLIHFKDFDFDLKKWQRFPFNSNNYFTSNRDYNLDEDILNIGNVVFEENSKQLIETLAPKTTKWLLESLGDQETLQTFLEVLGLSFLNYQPEAFFVFVKSSGGRGKSKLFEYIQSLFGENDVISLDFDSIIKDNSFDVAEFRRKSINLTSDVKASYIPPEAVAIIKALSSGDKRNLPQKFKGTAQFNNYANLWFNCNNMPRLSAENYDNSMARRTFIFDWFPIEGFNWEEKSKSFQKERGEFVVKALYYAKLALESSKKNYDYLEEPTYITRSNRIIKNYSDWKQEHNLLERFIDEKCKLGPNLKVGVQFLRTEYANYSTENGHKQNVAVENFEAQMKEQYGIVKSDKTTSWKHGTEFKTGVYVFKGIALKEDAGTQEEHQKYENDRLARRKASPFIPH